VSILARIFTESTVKKLIQGRYSFVCRYQNDESVILKAKTSSDNVSDKVEKRGRELAALYFTKLEHGSKPRASFIHRRSGSREELSVKNLEAADTFSPTVPPLSRTLIAINLNVLCIIQRSDRRILHLLQLSQLTDLKMEYESSHGPVLTVEFEDGHFPVDENVLHTIFMTKRSIEIIGYQSILLSHYLTIVTRLPLRECKR
jgi:hypothetical protein